MFNELNLFKKFTFDNFAPILDKKIKDKINVVILQKFVKWPINICTIGASVLRIIDNNKITYIELELKSTKHAKKIAKLLFSLFDKTSFLIIKLTYKDIFYYFINTAALNSQIVNEIIGTKTYFSKAFSSLDIENNFLLKSLSTNSIFDLFNSICYKFIYLHILEINFPFKYHIPYEVLNNYSKTTKLTKKIKTLNKKILTTYNNNAKVEINAEIMRIKKDIELYKEIFKQKYYEI